MQALKVYVAYINYWQGDSRSGCWTDEVVGYYLDSGKAMEAATEASERFRTNGLPGVALDGDLPGEPEVRDIVLVEQDGVWYPVDLSQSVPLLPEEVEKLAI